MNDTPDERIVTISVSEEHADRRMDKVVAEALPDLSRSEVQRLIKSGDVRVSGAAEKASYRVSTGEIITVTIPIPEPRTIDPEPIPLDILHEDDLLVAINKPAGMVVHPAYGNWAGTLVNAALHHWPQLRSVGPEERAGVVHRLDMDTSGVIVMAKTPDALHSLQFQFKKRTVYKRYIALVEGTPETSHGVIDAPIGRDPQQRKKMTVLRDGKAAQTRFDIEEDLGKHTLLSLEPRTGRTHQLRVHLAWLGHPIVGDDVYGYRKQRIKMNRMFLHAAELQVDHPQSGERLTFIAPLPVHLEDVLAKLRRNLPSHWVDEQ